MSTILCGLLDGYLGRWLTEPEETAFVGHLETCERCRRLLAEHQHLRALLMQALDQDRLPAGLMNRMEGQLRRSPRRRRLLAAAGMAAAAVIVLAVGFGLMPRRLPPAPALPVPVVEVPPPRVESPAVAVTFAKPAEVIAVPMRSENPAITIIWVYPVLSTDAPASSTTERNDT